MRVTVFVVVSVIVCMFVGVAVMVEGVHKKGK